MRGGLAPCDLGKGSRSGLQGKTLECRFLLLPSVWTGEAHPIPRGFHHALGQAEMGLNCMSQVGWRANTTGLRGKYELDT